MSEMSLKDTIETLKHIRKYYDGIKDVGYYDIEIQALSLAISRLQLLEQVEKNGIEKRPELASMKQGMTCSQCRQNYHSEDIGFNEAIDLCTVTFIEALDEEKIIKIINKFFWDTEWDNISEEVSRSLAKAIREEILR